ncbi:MAG: glycosyl hydrolase family 28-related protein [Haloarcula sp.]
MPTRRQLLKSGMFAGILGVAGCQSFQGSQRPRETNVTETPGQDSTQSAQTRQSTQTSTDSSHHDIRDYGARVDGETDDTGAINDALAATGPGETVVFPAGKTRVWANERGAITLDGSVADDVTITGAGRSTVVELLSTNDSRNQWCFGIDGSGSPIRGLTIRNMRISGNKHENSNRSAFGINMYPGGTGHSILIEDIETFDSSGKGLSVNGGEIRLNRITSHGNTGHGINLKGANTEWGSVPVTVTNAVCVDNAGTGIDHNEGSASIDGFWLENNAGGNKVTSKAKESWWRNGTFLRNGIGGFRYNGPVETQDYNPMRIHLDDLLSVENHHSGFYFAGDVRYDIGTIVARRNNTGNEDRGNVHITGQADIDAEAIYSENALHGYGLFYYSDSNSNAELYQHTGNPEKSIGGNLKNLQLEESVEGAAPDISTPSKSDLGAAFH